MVGAVILAAGGSSRLGEPKQFVRSEGRTLIARSVDAAESCKPIVVVAGGDWERVKREVGGDGVIVARNEGWERGIGSSIQVGVSRILEVTPELKAVIITVCDQPHADREHLAALRKAWETEGKGIVASRYGETVGVPALFERMMFSSLLALPDEQGAKGLIVGMGDEVAVVELPKGIVDIDTSEDLASYRARVNETT